MFQYLMNFFDCGSVCLLTVHGQKSTGAQQLGFLLSLIVAQGGGVNGKCCTKFSNILVTLSDFYKIQKHNLQLLSNYWSCFLTAKA